MEEMKLDRLRQEEEMQNALSGGPPAYVISA